ncbi:MAG TPA: YeeE/YedE thiosulfate transporter family protein [Polyangiales bacterium]
MLDVAWLSALLGGALIGASASLLWFASGRVAGISGILAGLIAPTAAESGARWELFFVLGLLGGGVLLRVLAPETLGDAPWSTLQLVVAGFLVGAGTRLGSGCTSGHGVCGISRGSRRSIVATLVFMATAMLTVFVLKHVLGWGR